MQKNVHVKYLLSRTYQGFQSLVKGVISPFLHTRTRLTVSIVYIQGHAKKLHNQNSKLSCHLRLVKAYARLKI